MILIMFIFALYLFRVLILQPDLLNISFNQRNLMERDQQFLKKMNYHDIDN